MSILSRGARYYVAVSVCQASCKGGGKYRRPVTIRVCDSHDGGYWHAVRNCPCGRRWSNVDSRYNGPRSAYGQALAAARELAHRLNAEYESALSASILAVD